MRLGHKSSLVLSCATTHFELRELTFEISDSIDGHVCNFDGSMLWESDGLKAAVCVCQDICIKFATSCIIVTS